MGSRVKGLNADFSADGLCRCMSVRLRVCAAACLQLRVCAAACLQLRVCAAVCLYSCVSVQLCACTAACLCNCLTVLSDGSGSQTGLFPADRLRTFCLAG